jgi:PQQ-dependent catabolism-associated beta-propeller protein
LKLVETLNARLKLGQSLKTGANSMTIVERTVLPLLVWLALMTQASAGETGYVFVSEEGTNNIAVIDPYRAYQIIKWIATDRRPRDMKFRDQGKKLLVACGDDDVIDVIDVPTLEVEDHIPTGHDPEVFEVSQDQRMLYVSNKERSTVQEISVADKIIENEIRTGAEPEGIAAASDGKTLYVTSGVSDWVHVVDLEARVVTDNISVGTRPSRFLLMLDGRQLWVSNEVSGEVSIIDSLTKQVTGKLEFSPPVSGPINITPFGMTLTKDGRTAFVALGRANYVAFVDTATRTIRDYVKVGQGPREVALNADESMLYVVNALSNDLSIVDVPKHTVVEAVRVGQSPHSVQTNE